MRRSPRPLFAGFVLFVLLTTACSTTTEPAAPNPVEDGEATATTSLAPLNNETTEQDAPAQETELDPVSIDELTDLAGQIVLIDRDERVVLTTPDGSSSQVLSTDGTSNAQPTWSNAGDRVAWSSVSSSGSSLSTALVDGTDQQHIDVASPAFYLSWSADDTWIGGLRPTSTGMEMFVANPTTQTDRQVSQAQPFYFDWASDDSIVAALGNQLLVDISASDAVSPLRRALEPPLGAFQAPALLPGGDVLAALIIDGNNTLSRLAGNQISEVATADGPMFLSASPNGRRVAVLVAARAGGRQQPESEIISFQFDAPIELELGRVTIIDLETGDVEVQPQERVVSMSWSPDSTTLAVLAFDGDGLRWNFRTPDGRTQGAKFSPSTRFVQRYLPFFDQYNSSATSWSPDSDAIVFSGSIGGESGIFVDVINDAAGPALIADGQIAFWSPN